MTEETSKNEAIINKMLEQLMSGVEEPIITAHLGIAAQRLAVMCAKELGLTLEDFLESSIHCFTHLNKKEE